MKRNETPLNASILLDALCSPITFTGNYALPVPSHPWLLKIIFGTTNASTLLAHFIPARKGLYGYYYRIKNTDILHVWGLQKSLNKKQNNTHKTDNKTTDIITC